MLDTGNGRRATHRGDQRFLMCSTWKVLAVTAYYAGSHAQRGGRQAVLAQVGRIAAAL